MGVADDMVSECTDTLQYELRLEKASWNGLFMWIESKLERIMHFDSLTALV
jgi:hypothetical protein